MGVCMCVYICHIYIHKHVFMYSVVADSRPDQGDPWCRGLCLRDCGSAGEALQGSDSAGRFLRQIRGLRSETAAACYMQYDGVMEYVMMESLNMNNDITGLIA